MDISIGTIIRFLPTAPMLHPSWWGLKVKVTRLPKKDHPPSSWEEECYELALLEVNTKLGFPQGYKISCDLSQMAIGVDYEILTKKIKRKYLTITI